MSSDVRERVQRGVALLDEKRPQWRESINKDTLKMSSMLSCVLGQLFGYYAQGILAVGLSDEDTEFKALLNNSGYSHGFDINPVAEGRSIRQFADEYRELDEAWQDVLS